MSRGSQKVICVDEGMSDMASIYKSEKGKKEILSLYDRQLVYSTDDI